jgi:hypothetical protein
MYDKNGPSGPFLFTYIGLVLQYGKKIISEKIRDYYFTSIRTILCYRIV